MSGQALGLNIALSSVLALIMRRSAESIVCIPFSLPLVGLQRFDGTDRLWTLRHHFPPLRFFRPYGEPEYWFPAWVSLVVYGSICVKSWRLFVEPFEELGEHLENIEVSRAWIFLKEVDLKDLKFSCRKIAAVIGMQPQTIPTLTSTNLELISVQIKILVRPWYERSNDDRCEVPCYITMLSEADPVICIQYATHTNTAGLSVFRLITKLRG